MAIVSDATGEATIDGTDASVVYTLAAIERIETRCGAAVMALIDRGQRMALTMVEVRAILQAGMEAHRRRSEVKGPAVTDAQAAEVMAAAGMMSVMLTCLDSLARSNELGLVTMPGVAEAMADATEGRSGPYDTGAMMARLARCGLAPDRAWHLTVGEAMMVVAGHNAARVAHRDDLLAGAWHGAAFTRVKRMPSLARVLRRERPAPALDDQRALHQALLEGIDDE